MFSILIFSCDKYSYLWDAIFHYLNSLIDLQNFSGKIYFLNEEKSINYSKFIQLKYGKSINGINDWSNMLKFGLNKIEEQNILFILDDLASGLRIPVSMLELNTMYDYFLKKDLNSLAVKCIDSNYPKLIIKNKIGNIEIGEPILNTSYIINCQLRFWKKQFLLSFLENDWRPLDFEHLGTKKMNQLLKNKDFELKNEFVIFKNYYDDLVKNGKLTDDGFRYIRDLGIYSLNFENMLCEIYNNCNGEFIKNISIENNELYINYYDKQLTTERNRYFKSCGLFVGLFYNSFEPKDEYKISFYGRSESLTEDLFFRIYTGIKWEIIDIPITKENKEFSIKSKFNFEASSVWRISVNKYPINNCIILSKLKIE